MVFHAQVIRRSFLALTLMSAVALPGCTSCNGPGPSGPLTGATVGFFLNHLMDQLQQTIDDARNAGLGVAMQAGREANIAIANAQNAYQDSLNETIDKVDPKIKGTLDQLQSLVNDVASNASLTLDDTTKRTQQIVNSLPFRSHQPQLTKILPRFVVPARQSYPAVIHFQGNFEYAARQDFTPIVESNGHQYTASQNSSQDLTFIIPVSDLFVISPDKESNQYDFTTAELRVPWETSGFLGLNKQRHEDRYKLIIGALPP